MMSDIARSGRLFKRGDRISECNNLAGTLDVQVFNQLAIDEYHALARVDSFGMCDDDAP